MTETAPLLFVDQAAVGGGGEGGRGQKGVENDRDIQAYSCTLWKGWRR